MSVVLETTLGDLTIDLHVTERPRTCLNFLKLCKIKYYNYCLFHKVEHNFSAQTGDPDGTGRGGESIFSHLYGDQAKYFDAEIKPRLKHTEIGTVSMTNNGQNMHASQFFITLGEELDYLDGEHTVFGQVVEGFETLQKLNETICDSEHRPYQDIRISHTVILEDPFDDPPGMKIPDMSPELTEEQLRSTGRIAPDEEIDDTKGKSIEEIEEEIQDKEAKARATILEMVGDIPDAEVAPPDNVLFVCKLNPVTTADDLEVIFARFGSIKSCEVIKDKKSGESLQYAFIEFDKPEDCENAYFKMDNVLIDDRRIHVDFSQSVSKLNYQELKQHAKRPKFELKEKSAAQRNNKQYDLIFEDEPKDSYRDLKKQIRQEERSIKNRGDDRHSSRKHRNPTPERSRKETPRTGSHPRQSGRAPSKGNKTRSPSSSSSSSGDSDSKKKTKEKAVEERKHTMSTHRARRSRSPAHLRREDDFGKNRDWNKRSDPNRHSKIRSRRSPEKHRRSRSTSFDRQQVSKHERSRDRPTGKRDNQLRYEKNDRDRSNTNKRRKARRSSSSDSSDMDTRAKYKHSSVKKSKR